MTPSGEITAMRCAAPLLLALTLLTVPATAQEDVNCAEPQNTVEMRFCASEDFKRADTKLNDFYRQMTSRLEAEPLAILKRSQRAWIDFRDAECEFQAYWAKGGTISPQLETHCMTALTENRVKQLEVYVNCEEGELTCPPAE